MASSGCLYALLLLLLQSAEVFGASCGVCSRLRTSKRLWLYSSVIVPLPWHTGHILTSTLAPFAPARGRSSQRLCRRCLDRAAQPGERKGLANGAPTRFDFLGHVL